MRIQNYNFRHVYSELEQALYSLTVKYHIGKNPQEIGEILARGCVKLHSFMLFVGLVFDLFNGSE